MVQAYTLSDRIVQQGYNDFESLVGMVFKSADYGQATITISSIDELRSANGIAPNTVPQVFAFRYLGDPSTGGAYSQMEDIFTGTNLGSNVIGGLFQNWGPDRQYVQIRSASIDYVFGSTAAAPLVAIKITADAFIAP